MTASILHVFATFGAGGPQVRATQIMAHCGERFAHRVVAMDGNTAAAALLPATVRCELLPAPPRRGFLASVRAQTRLLRDTRPDLVLTYNWGAIETVAAARRAGVPLVHHEDGFGPEEAEQRLRRRNWLRRWLLRDVPVLVPSANLLRIAVREWGLREANVHCLPNGVDLRRFRPQPAANPVPVIGTVGGLRAEKNHALLLDAFAAVTCPARLLVVGDGPLRSALMAQATRAGIADRVEFAGPQPDPAPWYHRMDLFALSSATEQMPLVLLEAMASGLPVVATDVGDVARVLPDGCRGGVVAAGDRVGLARALDDLLRDPARRTREAAANRAHCERQHELAGCLERFAAVYRAALARRRG
ncbi:MAG: glycosyltransferase [Planctomycetes bacterium]|nr:glycosyltransferase [Planctomycetota bacterium]